MKNNKILIVPLVFLIFIIVVILPLNSPLTKGHLALAHSSSYDIGDKEELAMALKALKAELSRHDINPSIDSDQGYQDFKIFFLTF